MFEFDPWALAVPTVLVGSFGVAVARSRGQWSLSLRLAGGARISKGAPRVCPHLGMADDPFAHREGPNEEHRCYLYMQRDRIDLSHQKGFCLSVAHVGCPWLQIHPDGGRQPLSARVAAAGRRAAAVTGPAVRKGAAAAVAATSTAATAAAHAASTTARTSAGRVHRAYRWAVDVAAPRTGAAAIAELARANRTAQFIANVVSDAVALFAGYLGAVGGKVMELLSAIASWAGQGLRWAMLKTISAFQRLRAALAEQAVAQTQRRADVAARRAATRPVDLSPAPDMPAAALTTTAPATPSPLIQPLASAGEKAGTGGNLDVAAAAQRAFAGDNIPMGVAAASLQPVTPLVRLSDNMTPDATPAGAFRSARRLMELGLAALETGDEEAAYQQFVAATEADPDNRRAWYWRAKTAPALTEVIQCLSIILDAEPENEQVQRSYAWAVERLEVEQRRARLVRREEPGPVPQTTHSSAPRRPGGALLGSALRGLARVTGGAACFVLAALWLGAAAVIALPDVSIPLPDAVRPFLPNLAALSVEFPDLAPGYRLLAWTPHTLAFLAFFTGLGILQRQAWARPWSLMQALSYLLVVAAQGYPGEGLALATALAAAVGAAVLANQASQPAATTLLLTTTRNLGRG